MLTVTSRAYAKINLSLRINAKRPDGFHDVQTILQAIDLSDRLKCQATRGPFQIVCSTPGVPTGRQNLIWRAAEALWNAAGREGEPRGVTITLDKQIPMQAGLGGGSSDAASALVALRKLWKLNVPDDTLFTVAARLGADVPYFLVNGTALGLGRGDEVYPLDNLPRWWVVLVFPPFGVPTADAYRWLDELRAKPAAPPAETRYLPGTWLGRVIPLANDLESPVVERHPLIGRLIRQLAKQGAVMSAMSGSGSTVFGVFTRAPAAERAARVLHKDGARARVVRLRAR